MFISATNIRQLIDNDPPLIAPCDRSFIEGNFYDLRLEEVYRTKDDEFYAFIGQKKRETPSIQPLESIDPKHISNRLAATDNVWKLYPGFYLAQTIETITPPRWLVALLDERTSMFRSAAIVRSTKVPYGYSGKITAAIHIPDACSLTLEKGMRFLSVCFALSVTIKLDSNLEPSIPLEINFDGSDKYKGIWGGSKVATDGTERAF